MQRVDPLHFSALFMSRCLFTPRQSYVIAIDIFIRLLTACLALPGSPWAMIRHQTWHGLYTLIILSNDQASNITWWIIYPNHPEQWSGIKHHMMDYIPWSSRAMIRHQTSHGLYTLIIPSNDQASNISWIIYPDHPSWTMIRHQTSDGLDTLIILSNDQASNITWIIYPDNPEKWSGIEPHMDYIPWSPWAMIRHQTSHGSYTGLYTLIILSNDQASRITGIIYPDHLEQ